MSGKENQITFGVKNLNQSLKDFKIKIWPNMVPKLKSCQTYLKLCALVNLEVLNTKLKLIFKDVTPTFLSRIDVLPRIRMVVGKMSHF